MKIRIFHYITVAVMLVTGSISAFGQQIRVSAGPEFLYSFNHRPSFYGVGGSVQADWWVRPALGLGLNSGYFYHKSTKTLVGSNNFGHYSAIPVLFVLRYPIPVIEGIYGQDMFGYTFAQGATYLDSDTPVKGGITYYFALGYEKGHFDVSARVGRPRFSKKNDKANVNEHNVGLKVAYVF